MSIQELVINFHMTELCNFRCEYCYATWETNNSQQELHHSNSNIEKLITKVSKYFLNDNPIKEKLNYQDVRINFAGGEPIMLGNRFVNAILLAKKLGLRTSLITNGHLLSSSMLSKISPHLDMLGISFDTADHLLAESIGRVDRKNDWLSPEKLEYIVNRYRSINPNGIVKINTVVNAFNWREDLTEIIGKITPNKWKLLRVLPVYSNKSVIDEEKYLLYIKRHKCFSDIITIENNDDMWQSYLMLNPEGRFYQNTEPCKGIKQSPSILDTSIHEALSFIDFNSNSFTKRYNK
ncbi:viperin family antiviral radical SAM protein [Photobacterium leiognathi]|uniref:viperin family antiviral radical SAM protein n=1 Tax=Photobacterium leiognathi TaxID=553611 RepID=UPI00273A5190|nr:viperin family antiviral radical SAM protein [Photobacterium leiognathi]